MSGRASASTLGALALGGLRRKIGRNLLTVSGVFVGVFALTLIVSLGQGMARLVRTTVSGEDNLRQIGLSGGLGRRIGDDPKIEIEGEMTEERRRRLERSAKARSRPGTFIGRRAQALDLEALEAVEALPKVASTFPIVLERYKLTRGETTSDATATVGLDFDRRRYADRVIAGRYFSGPAADEVLIHEYLAYSWGLVTPEELASLVGETIVLEPIGAEAAAGVAGAAGGMARAFLERADLSSLTDEEREMLPGIVEKLGRAFLGRGAGGEQAPGAPRTFEIVGVVRELEPTDPFNVIEDGNAFQVDVFLPEGAAIDFFLSSPVNRELGFSRAVVLVEDARYAREVETELRDKGYTAYSVATVVGRIEGFLLAITIAVSVLTGIALFVAALGIVNTMVTSVIERTREIGLWKAIGASSGQIRVVFILEAAMIGLLGGLLGLGVAMLVQLPAEEIAMHVIRERAAFPIRSGVFYTPPWLPIAGPLLATAIAMLAALYPAHRAARIDPVRALHHE